MKPPAKLLPLGNRETWREWLQLHHASEKEAWLVIRKKQAIQPGITYDEALDEALCFGWIDGLMRSVDDQTFTLRFSPRKSRSIWSEGNKQRVGRLIEQGLMTEAGLAKIREAWENGEWDKAAEREDTSIMHADLEQALQRDGRIWVAWEGLAPSLRTQYIYWVASARTEETRRRRIRETVRVVAEGREPGVR